VDSVSEARYAEWASSRLASLHRFAFLLCGDWHTAEDLVQEALAKTAVHWKRVEAAEHPDAYVRRILVNTSHSMWRRHWRRPRQARLERDVAIPDGADERARRDELMTALRQLPERQRATVVLRYFLQLSEAETAQTLDCSVGTVKSQTSKALAALRRAIPAEAPTVENPETLSC
jgi:RNA polymerase sigma-70 factor (sigma-E family)